MLGPCCAGETNLPEAAVGVTTLPELVVYCVEPPLPRAAVEPVAEFGGMAERAFGDVTAAAATLDVDGKFVETGATVFDRGDCVVGDGEVLLSCDVVVIPDTCVVLRLPGAAETLPNAADNAD